MITHLLRKAILLAVPLFAGTFSVSGQNFVPSVAHEFTYSGPFASYSTDMSCFSFTNNWDNTAWGPVDVYLSARGCGQSDVMIQFTTPHDPTNVLYQTYFKYDDGSYFQVGAVHNDQTGQTQILVAYQLAGFHVDIYDITSSATTPVVYNSTINLVPWTVNTNYFEHRIRMDSHTYDLSKVAIVWDNPYQGLQAIGCENGNWGNIVNIDNTAGQSGPDIAFSMHSPDNTASVYIVYHDLPGTEITTASLPFSDLMTATGTVYPAVQDINTVSVPLASNLVLDCPDLTYEEAWAYTYTDQQNSEVYVRHKNAAYSPTPNTISVNSGSLGNAPLSAQYMAFSPSLHYGNNYAGIENNIVVGWYNTDGLYNGYIALKMGTDPYAPSLVSDADYLRLPNAATPSPYSMSVYNRPGIAFSKGDIELATRFLYTTYYDTDPASGASRLHHAFHDWGITVFKPAPGPDVSIAETSPNPFTDVLQTAITLQAKGRVLLELTDMSGRMVARQEADAEKGTYPVRMNGLKDVIAGTYFLSTSVDGKKVNTRIVIKK